MNTKLKLPTLLILILIIPLSGLMAQKNTGIINGKVTNAKDNKAVAFANVILFQANQQIKGTSTDFDGKYSFKNLIPGKYKIQITALGFETTKKEIIVLAAGNSKTVNFFLMLKTKQLEDLEIVLEERESTISKGEIMATPILSNANQIRIKRYKKDKSAGYSSRMAPIEFPRDNFNTEAYAHNPENNFKNAKSTPLSTFSIDVDAASYSNMRRFINNGQNPPVDAVRIEEMVNYFNYDYPQPKGDDPFSITTEMSDCAWNPKHKLIHVGIQGEKIETDNLPSSNLVFLLDVSGSMGAPNKLPLLKKSFGLLVKNLTEKDRVAIVVYAGAAGLVLPSTPGNQKEKILNALNNLNAGGSTAGGAGIKLAYKIAAENFINEGNNRVILATDGDFNIGASSDGEMTRLIEKKRESGVFLTCLGFGMGNYKDSKMETLADKGNGNYAY
ncbi:MAG: VWA domain-containing protein, partial [Vicingaceae bacterium]